MPRIRIASIPSVRRKWRADAELFAAYAAALALIGALCAYLHPFAGLAFISIGLACVLGYILRQAESPMDETVRGITAVVHRDQSPVLWDAVADCAAVVGMRRPKIFLFDGRVNLLAASWGFGSGRSIGMQRSLVSRLPAPWIKATVSHEVAHMAMGDLLTSAMLTVVRGWLQVVSPLAAIVGLLAAIGSTGFVNILIGLCVAAVALLASLGSELAEALWKPHVRFKREYAADALGIAITSDPLAAIGLMVFLAVSLGQNRTDPRPLPGRTHPPPLVRINVIARDHPEIFR